MEYVSSSLRLLSTMLSFVDTSTRRDRSSGLLIVHVSVVSIHIVSNNAVPLSLILPLSFGFTLTLGGGPSEPTDGPASVSDDDLSMTIS